MARVSLLLLAVSIGAVYSNPITAPYYKPLTQEQGKKTK